MAEIIERYNEQCPLQEIHEQILTVLLFVMPIRCHSNPAGYKTISQYGGISAWVCIFKEGKDIQMSYILSQGSGNYIPLTKRGPPRFCK